MINFNRDTKPADFEISALKRETNADLKHQHKHLYTYRDEHSKQDSCTEDTGPK